MLIVRDATIQYEKKTAVQSVDFELLPGEFLTVFGENGSGKSTLMKSVLGLLPLRGGSIKFTDLEIGDIGYLPQNLQVQQDFPASVNEVILSGFSGKSFLKPFYSKAEKRRACEIAENLNIMPLRRECYRELSRGQQQRVLLARALCSARKLLMLDEPATGLDPLMRDEIYSILENIHRREGMSVMMISHDLENSIRLSDKILHLNTSVLYFGDINGYLNSKAYKNFNPDVKNPTERV